MPNRTWTHLYLFIEELFIEEQKSTVPTPSFRKVLVESENCHWPKTRFLANRVVFSKKSSKPRGRVALLTSACELRCALVTSASAQARRRDLAGAVSKAGRLASISRDARTEPGD